MREILQRENLNSVFNLFANQHLITIIGVRQSAIIVRRVYFQ